MQLTGQWKCKWVVKSVHAIMQSATQLPYFIDGANACPPEDVDGAPGYEGLLEAMADPKPPEHDDMAGWYGGISEPAGFDCQRVSQWFKRIKI